MTAWRLLRCNPLSHGGVDYASFDENKAGITYKNNPKKVAI
jgi:putative component of membrane protein insertase Oxa1/YidC/SpoIIIJ protein YidD